MNLNPKYILVNLFFSSRIPIYENYLVSIVYYLIFIHIQLYRNNDYIEK